MFMGGSGPPPNIETNALVKDTEAFSFLFGGNKLTIKTLLSDFHRKFNFLLTLQCHDGMTHVALEQTLKITLHDRFLRSRKVNSSIS